MPTIRTFKLCLWQAYRCNARGSRHGRNYQASLTSPRSQSLTPHVKGIRSVRRTTARHPKKLWRVARVEGSRGLQTSQVLRGLEGDAKLTDFGADVSSTRQTRTGEMILELKRDKTRKDASYKRVAEEVLGASVEVRALTTQATLKLKNLMLDVYTKRSLNRNGAESIIDVIFCSPGRPDRIGGKTIARLTATISRA